LNKISLEVRAKRAFDWRGLLRWL